MNIEMANILPVKYPTITTLPGYAHPLSILYAHPQSYDWIYSHFIQTYAIETNDAKDNRPVFLGSLFGDYDYDKQFNRRAINAFTPESSCPFFLTYNYPSMFVNDFSIDIVEILKKSIDCGFYILVDVDVSKIIQYKNNIKKALKHAPFIYGYDNDKESFYFADFPNNSNNVYTYDLCSFDDIKEAYEAHVKSLESLNWHCVTLIKFKKNNLYKLDFDYLKQNIKNYIYPNINQQAAFKRYLNRYYNNNSEVYIGVDVYKYLDNFIQRVIEYNNSNENIFVDQRFYHAMFEHKKMMAERFNYLTEKGYLNESKNQHIINYNEIVNKMHRIENIIMKNNVKRIYNNMSIITNLFQEIREYEIELLYKIFIEA